MQLLLLNLQAGLKTIKIKVKDQPWRTAHPTSFADRDPKISSSQSETGAQPVDQFTDDDQRSVWQR